MDYVKILLVDDDKDICEILTGYLVDIFEEIEVTCVHDGGEALHKINFNTFDFIFFDLKLPTINGVDLIKATREKSEDDETEIYVISGNINLMAKKCISEFHIRGVIEKPFTYDDIIEMIRESKIRKITSD
ncbi:MAG: hypothetical protein CME68_05460 [Halobacteriovoraceae bacterium]|nr:hypothetical protein [Halobacteriovoraceae bacterium]